MYKIFSIQFIRHSIRDSHIIAWFLGRAPYPPYDVSRPINISNTDIDGVEFAVQHMFTSVPAPFDGLGVIANFTKTDSKQLDISASYDNTDSMPLFFEGIDVTNAEFSGQTL